MYSVLIFLIVCVLNCVFLCVCDWFVVHSVCCWVLFSTFIFGAWFLVSGLHAYKFCDLIFACVC